MYVSAKIAYECSLFCIFGCSISMLSNNAVRKEPWIPIVRRKVRMQKSKKFFVKASPMPDKASKDNEKIKAFRLPKISAISPKKNIHKWKQKKTEKPFLEFLVLRWILSNSLIYVVMSATQFGAKINNRQIIVWHYLSTVFLQEKFYFWESNFFTWNPLRYKTIQVFKLFIPTLGTFRRRE